MKKIILMLLVCCMHGVVMGQEIYQFKSENVLAVKIDSLQIKNPLQQQFFSMKLLERLEGEKISTKNFYKKIGEEGEFIKLQNTTTKEIITVSRSEFNEKSNLITSRWNFGVLTLPMKIRFGGGSEEKNTRRYFDLSADFNLGLTLSYKLDMQNFTSEIQTYWVLALGTTQVKLTPESTNNFIDDDQVSSAFSPSTGLVFQFNKEIQFTTIIGWDFVPGKIGREWVYRDKPFFGLGLGFKVFEIGKKPEQSKITP